MTKQPEPDSDQKRRLSPGELATQKRREQKRGAQKPDRSAVWVAIVLTVFSALLIGGAILYQNNTSTPAVRVIPTSAVRATSVAIPITGTAAATTTLALVEGVQVFQEPTTGHTVVQMDYNPLPPVGGLHRAEWQNCGIYDQPVQAENAVHSLEHGAVWITYQPELTADAIGTLKGVVRGNGYALLSPAANLPAPIVASAWGMQLRLTDASDPRIAEFVSKYASGPQAPEKGAACRGGVGTPS